MTLILLLLKLGTLRLASFHRDVSYGGETYTAAGALHDLQLPSHTLEPSELTLSFQISLIAHKESVEGLAPVEAEAFILYSEDGGQDWLGPAYQFAGRLSRSAVRDRLWSGSVDRDRHNLLAAFGELTHERQMELHPGDLGLERMAALERGIKIEL